MKVLKISLALMAAALLAVFGMQMIASESAEVVVLLSQGGDGEEETRLWVVDHDGMQYLRASAGSGWYKRLVAEPQVRLQRDGDVAAYRAEPSVELAGEINELMARKYGWRDSYISVVTGGRDDAIAVRLIPTT